MKSLGEARTREEFRILLLLLVLTSIISYSVTCSFSSPEGAEEANMALWVIFRVRDYRTDMPISNVSVTAVITSDWISEINTPPRTTNETGAVKVLIGNAPNVTIWNPPRVVGFSLGGNYVVIKVIDSLIEDLTFEAEYKMNVTSYWSTKVHRWRQPSYWSTWVNLPYKVEGDQVFIECNLWVLKGKLVKVTDCDPVTGERVDLVVKPAVRADVKREHGMSPYESYYLFPINYTVTITYELDPVRSEIYTPLKITVKEDTVLVNWMYHAMKSYKDYEISNIDEEIELFNSLEFSLVQETENYQVVKGLFNRVLVLYKEGEYDSAIGGAKIAVNAVNNLKRWFSNLRVYAILTSIGICLFAYGLSSLIPKLLLEENVSQKIRLAVKMVVFSSILLLFSLTHSSLKMTFLCLAESLLNAPTQRLDLPTTLWGCFLIGSVTYFLIVLISVKKTPMTDLALKLGTRGLRRRPSRSLLTLFSITIVVASAVVLIDISSSYSTRVKEVWKSTDIDGIIVRSDLFLAPLSEYDVNWTVRQEWCKEIGYVKEVRPYSPSTESDALMFTHVGLLVFKEDMTPILDRSMRVDIVCINPDFMDEHFNLSNYIRGCWQEFKVGEKVALLPNLPDLSVSVGDYVGLAVADFRTTIDGREILVGTREYNGFRVVGKFNPLIISELKKIDNTPLFKNPFYTVLIPIKSIDDPAIVISEVTITPRENVDPTELARHLAYTFGAEVILNKDGLARKFVWSMELTLVGFVPYLFPLTIAGLMVYLTMTSVYEERKNEFTLLATLGLDPKNTFQTFIVETLVLGFSATFLGFLGSYMITILFSQLANLLKAYGIMGVSTPTFYAKWSLGGVIVALFTGIVPTFLGGYIPAVRAMGLSLMGRFKRRQIMGELAVDRETCSFTLPLRVHAQSGEMLYTYVRENVKEKLRKLKLPSVDPHSVKGEIHRDGTFAVSFTILSPGGAAIPFELKGIRSGESLTPTVIFPTRHRDYGKIKDILRDLEELMIDFPLWMEMRRKMKVVREAPKKPKTPEEIVAEVKKMVEDVLNDDKKLQILESRKDQLSEEVYNEFREKYLNRIDEKLKTLRSVTVNLEAYYNQLKEEMKKIEIEVERITIAYNLGEITEEEYIRTCGPLRGNYATLKRKAEELEEIFNFLKAPSRTFRYSRF